MKKHIRSIAMVTLVTFFLTSCATNHSDKKNLTGTQIALITGGAVLGLAVIAGVIAANNSKHRTCATPYSCAF